ncbi:MAG: DsrE family protein [Woeseiaceae bacterium]
MPRIIILLLLSMAASIGLASDIPFERGPVIEAFGPVAIGETSLPLSPESRFKIAFDVASAAKDKSHSRQLESAARLLNLHAKLGIPQDRTEIAIVVHGAAALDLTKDQRYGRKNPSADLIAALIDAGVTIQLCGQTAAYRDIEIADLLPGIEVLPSAMTAHALLQQDGFTLNPF